MNQKFEVSIPDEKPKAAAPKPTPTKSLPSFAESLSFNAYALLSDPQVSEPGWETKKGKGKETRRQPSAGDTWSSNESITLQLSQDTFPQDSSPAGPPSPNTPQPQSSSPAPSTSEVPSKVQIPSNLSNFRPHLPVEDDNVVDDWTQLLPDDSDGEE